MNELMIMFELRLSNENEFVDGEHQWIFCSSSCIKRRIDYLMHGPSIQCVNARPTDFLDLSSDQRAVSGNFVIRTPSATRSNAKRRQKAKGWKPELDEDGVPRGYHDALNSQLQSSDRLNAIELSNIIASSASAFARKQNYEVDVIKPSKCLRLKALIRERRACRDPWSTRRAQQDIA